MSSSSSSIELNSDNLAMVVAGTFESNSRLTYLELLERGAEAEDDKVMADNVVLFASVESYRAEQRPVEARCTIEATYHSELANHEHQAADEWRAVEAFEASYRRELVYREHNAAEERRAIEASQASYGRELTYCEHHAADERHAIEAPEASNHRELAYRAHRAAYEARHSAHYQAWEELQEDIADEEEVTQEFPAVATAATEDVIIISFEEDDED